VNKKIFRSSCLVAILVLLSSFVLIMGVLFGVFEDRLENELESEINYISQAVRNEGEKYFDGMDMGGKRVTLIAPDGEVIFDTAADAEDMDNHADREEVKQALETGSGKSSRYSGTLTEKTVYYAVRLSDGNILRISATQYSVLYILLGMLQPVIIVFLIAVILSAVLSARVSSSIVKPINDLDLDDPEQNETYEEIAPLLFKIAKQKDQINAQLREAGQKREEFRLITENMSEGFLVIDIHTNLLTYNQAALKLLEIDSVNSGSVLKLNRTRDFRRVVNEALGGSRIESPMAQNGRHYNLIANPVREDGRVIGAVIVILDVTEIVKRETLRREFTANVSHELKTPLTSISGFAELMKDGGMPEETVKDFSKSIYDEAQRLISLVSDIIRLSELDENSVRLETETVDLYDLSKEMLARLKNDADKRNITLNLIGQKTEINGVRRILAEIVGNLCDNAVKYNKDGGSVDVIISESEHHVSLSVRDTGIGIPQAHQDRVFERFYRVDKSHSKAVGGTGLGLSIVKHGAACHNAAISLHSTEGVGTTVTVTFNK
jgi:two-component system phosphate regulon sensor histidine kinase PhoR